MGFQSGLTASDLSHSVAEKYVSSFVGEARTQGQRTNATTATRIETIAIRKR